MMNYLFPADFAEETQMALICVISDKIRVICGNN